MSFLGAFLPSAPAFSQGFLVWGDTSNTCISGGGFFPCFGYSVAKGGDFDGDGVADLLVGAPTNYPPPTYGGFVEVRSGVDGALLLTVFGNGQNTRLGWSVAALGDQNGDGVPDFVAGAPQFGQYFSNAGTGFARVFSGANGATLSTLFGSAAGNHFGWSVSGAGDLDGDGIEDLVVGAMRLNTAPPAPPAYVRVSSGSSGATLFTITTTEPAQMLGASVAGGADLTGDGLPDLLVGGPRLGAAVGEVGLYSGPTGALAYSVPGTILEDLLGWSVALAGDLDADGTPDFVAGAPGNAPIFWFLGVSPPGSARAFSGATGATIFSFSESPPLANAYDGFGGSVAGGEDMNADGIPDIVVGAPGVDRVHAYSGANGASLAILEDAPPLSLFGYSVALPGDLNGDGFAAFAVGAPYDEAVRTFSWVGVPPGGASFGTGCPGSGGITPEVITFGAFPSTATGSPSFGAVLTKALGGSTAVLILGFSFQSWNGVPLPLNLTPFGLPGCSLLVAGHVFLLSSTDGAGAGDGNAFFPLPVPQDPALSGLLLHLQGYVTDPGPSPFPGAMSGALQIILS